jgi:hypothetical protein
MKLSDHPDLQVLPVPILAEAGNADSVVVAHDHVQAMDAAACVMIALLFFLLGCVLFAAWRLHKRSEQASPLEGLETEATNTPRNDSPPPNTWERDADWWKR